MLFEKFFGKNDKFKEGMIAGAKPFEEKFRKQEEAIERVGKDLSNKLDEINTVTDVIIDELSAKQKKELYDLNTKFDISTLLSIDEKDFLASVLVTVANEQDETNEYQRAFVRSVLRYINVKNPQPSVTLSSIENIESISAQKAIMQVIMEFFFLGTKNHRYIETYNSLFSYFSVNQTSIVQMQQSINNIYKATGCEGIAEKYGYIPNETDDELINTSDIASSFDVRGWEQYLKSIEPYTSFIKSNNSEEGYINNAYILSHNKVFYLERLKTKYDEILQIKAKSFNEDSETIIIDDIGETVYSLKNFHMFANKNYIVVMPDSQYADFAILINTITNETSKIDSLKCLIFLSDKYMIYTDTRKDYPARSNSGGIWGHASRVVVTIFKYEFEKKQTIVLEKYAYVGGNYVEGTVWDNLIEKCLYVTDDNERLYYLTTQIDGPSGKQTFQVRVLDFINCVDSKQICSITEEKARPERCPSLALTPRFEKDNGYLYLKMIGHASENLFKAFRIDKA
ncbi:hypothetical protein [Clostridium sp. JNZ J1-5]